MLSCHPRQKSVHLSPLYPPDNARANPRLVSLRTEDEHDTRPHHQAPLPGNGRLIKNTLRERRDVDSGGEREDAHDDRAKEEVILGELSLGVRGSRQYM